MLESVNPLGLYPPSHSLRQRLNTLILSKKMHSSSKIAEFVLFLDKEAVSKKTDHYGVFSIGILNNSIILWR